LKQEAQEVPGSVFCATDCTLAELTMIRDQLLLLRGKLFKNA